MNILQQIPQTGTLIIDNPTEDTTYTCKVVSNQHTTSTEVETNVHLNVFGKFSTTIACIIFYS